MVLVVCHALLAVVACGSAGHLGVLSVSRLRGQVLGPNRLLGHAKVLLGSLLACFVVGLLAYPHYRYHVRGLQLDRDAPWASNLFDLKENLAALTLPLGLALVAMERDQSAPRLAAGLGVFVASSTFFLVVSGLVVTLVRGG